MNARIALLALLAASSVLAADSSQWKKRTIYQLLTDRFALTDGGRRGCDNHNYCGGTFEGIRRKLDYIQGTHPLSTPHRLFPPLARIAPLLRMGFDAIWISPVLKNSDNGYHGYWTNNFFAINEHFGTEQQLRDLINDAHNRSMYVMIGEHCPPPLDARPRPPTRLH
eukprot:m51a1_g13592 putative alpha-amylase (167) ;mRNA; f:1097-1990